MAQADFVGYMTCFEQARIEGWHTSGLVTKAQASAHAGARAGASARLSQSMAISAGPFDAKGLAGLRSGTGTGRVRFDLGEIQLRARSTIA